MAPSHRSFYPAILLAALAMPQGYSQQVAPKEPVYYAGVERPARPQPPGMRAAGKAPRFAIGRLSDFENARIDFHALPPRTGVHRDLPASILDRGGWTTLESGRRVWRIEIASAGSASLRVRFEDVDLDDGKVWIYGPGDFVDGPYSGRGIFDDGAFWSATIEADVLTVEYEPASEDESIPFRLTRISHRVAAPAAAAAPGLLRSIGLAATPTRIGPLADDNADPAAACNLDVLCYPEWSQAASMVGIVHFEINGEPSSCSGTLMATRNNSLKPYFLTAAHCIASEGEARTAEVFWQYQTSQCRGPHPTSLGSVRSATGASLLSASTPLINGDYSLVRLRDVPSGVMFSGWDPGEPALLSTVTGIHHPQGSHKRISFGIVQPSVEVEIDDLKIPGDTTWFIKWRQGLTEPGSSGSPLFIGPGISIGVLSYGLIAVNFDQCALEEQLSGYGRMSQIYPAIRDYLEDLPGTEVAASPTEVTFRVRNGALVSASPVNVNVTTASATAVRFNARADATYIKLSANTGSTSASSPARLAVSIDPAQFRNSGTFQSTVTLTQGSAIPRFLNVRVESVVDRSNVTVTAAPNPVYEQAPDADGMRFAFGLRVAESAGVATRLVSMKINGEDYTPHIERLFGGAQVPANGAVEAKIKANVPYAPSEQYIELGGVDEGSGQRWYRTVSVRFLPAQ